MTILEEILVRKRIEVAEAKQRRSAHDLGRAAEACSDPPRGFRAALAAAEGVAVIAEVKRQSPSKGLIREDFDAVEIARSYAAGGAACLSVLTDTHFFGGSLEILEKVRAAVDCPLLRKDFVVDPYQIDEARLAGADAVLLIVAALAPSELERLHADAKRRGLDVLVEVHDERELDLAMAAGSDLIGVNNRDLRTFEVDLATTERLAARIPRDDRVLLVAESGIRDAGDIERLESAGARAFLVGESLMREPDPGRALEALRRRDQSSSRRERSS